MSDAYFKIRIDPFDLGTEETEVAITSSGAVLFPTGAWREDGTIVVCLLDGTTIKSYSSTDNGESFSLMATLATLASGPFIGQDMWSGTIPLVYWDSVSEKIMFNLSDDGLSSLIHTTPKTVYNTAVDEQQPSVQVVGAGRLLVTFVDETDDIVSYYSDDYGDTWSAVT